MNQDDIKKIITNYIPKETTGVNVVFTGKSSVKCDSVYNSETSDILIHNRNLNDNNALVYVALHELTHHILFVRTGKVNNKHTAEFYSENNRILKEAAINGDFIEIEDQMIHQALDYGKKHTVFLKEYGKVLVDLKGKCIKSNYSFADVAVRKLGLTSTEAESIMRMFAVDVSEELPGDLARKISKIKDLNDRHEAEKKKEVPKAVAPQDQEEEEVFIAKELKRLDKRIKKDQERRDELELLLEGLTTDD